MPCLGWLCLLVGTPKILYGKDLGKRGNEKSQIVGYQRVVKDGLWEMGKRQHLEGERWGTAERDNPSDSLRE